MISEVSTNLNQSCSIYTFEDHDKIIDDNTNHHGEFEFCRLINQAKQVC